MADGSREFPGFALPSSFPTWDHATGARMTDTRGREALDLAMGFGTALYGHGVVPRAAMEQYVGDNAAGGLGDLMQSSSRVRATRALTLWAAPSWGSHGVAADELRALVLHTGSEAVETALKTALFGNRAVAHRRVHQCLPRHVWTGPRSQSSSRVSCPVCCAICD